ncbi:hypothetical protein STAWA0001_0331, partial [Staphylococcus warneri L37603]
HHRARRRPVRLRALGADQRRRPHDPPRRLLPRVAGGAPGRGERLRAHPPGLRVLRGPVRPRLPVREVRPAVRARVQRRRDGERRLCDLPRVVRLPRDRAPGADRAPRHHDPPRARPHVVRRPGDDALVERPVAQRVLRRVHVHARRRREHAVHRRLDHLLRHGEELGLPPGPALLHAPHQGPDPRPRRRARQLRRHHLRQGRLRAPPARGLGWPGELHGRRPRV